MSLIQRIVESCLTGELILPLESLQCGNGHQPLQLDLAAQTVGFTTAEKKHSSVSHGCIGLAEPRLIDPPAHKSLQEELQECMNLMMYGNERGENRLSQKEL